MPALYRLLTRLGTAGLFGWIRVAGLDLSDLGLPFGSGRFTTLAHEEQWVGFGLVESISGVMRLPLGSPDRQRPPDA
jgi:hypothetical protein